MTDSQSRRPVVATIGSFDGVHRGHKALLAQVVARAAALDSDSAAVTFDPIPDLIVYPDRQVTELTDADQKRDLIRSLGIDHVLIFPFTRELSMLRPEEFIGQVQAEHPLAELWVGTDFAMGRDRAGTISALAEIGSVEGFALHVVPPVKVGHQVISSTFIRTLLVSGDVSSAAALLGHHYALSGTVVRGAERGRTLNFPTANVEVPLTRTVPADGVYAATVRVDGQAHPAVLNLGGRPTFDDAHRLIEAHLLDFEGDLYKRRLTIEFVQRLRDTRRFGSVDELVGQIARDVQSARQVLDSAAVQARR